MQRKYIFLIIGIVIAALLAGGMVWYGSNIRIDEQYASKEVQESEKSELQEPEKIRSDETQQQKKFVTNVDPDVNHWQTKETETFRVKFPKEWYWLELAPEKSGYYGSHIISNNPDFPLVQYPDIEIFTGSNYSLIFTNDSEVVVTIRGWSTGDEGTPQQSIDSEIRRVKEDVNPSATCEFPYLSNRKSVPLTAYCSFINEDHQNVQTYYIAYNKTTFGFTARTTEHNAVQKDILEKIARSFTVKDDSFN